MKIVLERYQFAEHCRAIKSYLMLGPSLTQPIAREGDSGSAGKVPVNTTLDPA